jgi:hypothetical protein
MNNVPAGNRTEQTGWRLNLTAIRRVQAMPSGFHRPTSVITSIRAASRHRRGRTGKIFSSCAFRLASFIESHRAPNVARSRRDLLLGRFARRRILSPALALHHRLADFRRRASSRFLLCICPRPSTYKSHWHTHAHLNILSARCFNRKNGNG